VGDWGRCAGICTTNTPWWILSCWGFQCYSCVLGICARQISQDYCRLQRCRQILVVFFGFWSTTDGASTKISSASVVAMLRSFARSDSIDCCKAIVLSSLIYLLLMRRQTWALKSRLKSRGRVDALANEISHSLCRAKRILGDELFGVANGEQIQKAGKATMPLVCRRSPD
jgi:hypothetical protein